MKTEQLLQIYKAGISWDLHAKLCIIADGATYLFPNTDFTDCKLLGYCDFELKLTKSGQELLAKCSKSNKTVQLSVNYKEILAELEKAMLKFIGKKQIQGFGGVYFRPTEVELKQFLERFWKQYPEYKDVVKITKILCKHIETCSKKNSFAPAIKYFILKEQSKGMYSSQLAAAYESFEEKDLMQTNTSSEITI